MKKFQSISPKTILAVHKNGGNDWIFTQRIELDCQLQNIFLSDKVFALSSRDNWLIFFLDRQQNQDFLGTKYELLERIKLNSSIELTNVKLKGKDLSFEYEEKIPAFHEPNKKKKFTWQNDRKEKPEKQMKIQNKQRKNQRILQEVKNHESDPILLKKEDGPITGMKFVQNNLLYTGDFIKTKMLKFSDQGFEQVLSFSKQQEGSGIEYDPERKWFFEGKGIGKISFYQVKEDSLIQEQVIEGVKKTQSVFSLDLYEDYLLANFANELLVYKWDGTNFNLNQNLNSTGYGARFCSNGQIYAIKSGNKNIIYIFEQRYGTYFIRESISSTQFSDYCPQTFVSTDDCRSLVTVPYDVKNISTLDYVIGSRRDSKYSAVFTRVQRAFDFRKPCTNTASDILVTTHRTGAYIWKQKFNNLFQRTSFIYSQNGFMSCAMNEEVIVLGSDSGQLVYVEQTQFSPSYQFGKKVQFSVSKLQDLTEAGRTIIDIKASGSNLAVVEEYVGLRVYKKTEGLYSINETLDHWMFLSSVIIDDVFDFMMDGSYNTNSSLYIDSGQEFSQPQNITTHSPILCMDFHPEMKRLILGHMNGQIDTYQWDYATYFHPVDSFPSAGTRIYDVKICPDDSIVSLKEQEGRFYLVTLGADGSIIQSLRLPQLPEIKFAASEDCNRVFLSCGMMMQVRLYIKDEDGEFALWKTIQQDFPVYDIATNAVGDVFVVNIHTNHSSVMYKYDECTDDISLAAVIVGEQDHYVAAMTEEEIMLADLQGKVTVYSYTYLVRETCYNFGAKTITDVTEIEGVQAPRSITDLEIAGNVVIASSMYSGMLFFEIPESGPIQAIPFTDRIFISCVSTGTLLKAFAAGTFNKTILIYADFGSGYALSQTFTTSSQVTALHLTLNRLLVGTIDGYMREFAFSALSFSLARLPFNTGGHVYGVRICFLEAKIALLETEGVFYFKFYLQHGGNASFTRELEEELIEPYLDASSDCSIIAISGITMQKVLIFREDNGYSLFETINIGNPISKVSIEKDGDLLVVSSLVSQETYIYQYHICTGKYISVQNLTSEAYPELSAISSEFIVQGNEDGTIQIHSYSWNYHPFCEDISHSSSSIRQKNSNDEEAYNEKKITSIGPENLEQNLMLSQLNQGTIVLIILGSVFAVSMFIFFFYRSVRKKKRQSNDQTQIESGKQISTCQACQQAL